MPGTTPYAWGRETPAGTAGVSMRALGRSDLVAAAAAYGEAGDAIRAYLGLPPRPTPPPG